MGNQFSDAAQVLVGVKQPLPFLPAWMLSEILSEMKSVTGCVCFSINTEIPKNASLWCFR